MLPTCGYGRKCIESVLGEIANCTEIQAGQREMARMNVQNKLGEPSTYLSYSGSIVLTWTTTTYIHFGSYSTFTFCW